MRMSLIVRKIHQSMQYEVTYTQMDQEISYMDIKWISEISLQLFCKFKITSKYKLKNKLNVKVFTSVFPIFILIQIYQTTKLLIGSSNKFYLFVKTQ